MSDPLAPRRLRFPVAASLGLLTAGVGIMIARAETLQWHWAWVQYRSNAAFHAQWLAKAAAKHVSVSALLAAPPPRPVLTTQWILSIAAVPALSVLVLGVLALLLVANGRRVAWLPLVVAATFLNEAGIIVDGYGGWTTAAGRATSVLVVAVAVLPLLVVTRGRPVTRQRLPRTVLAVATVGVAVPAGILYAGPNNANVPEPLATLAVLLYGALIAGSSLPRRWLPAALGVPVIALPGVGWALVDGSAGGDRAASLVTLGLLAYAAALFAVRLPLRWLPLALAVPISGLPQLRGAVVDGLNGYSPQLPSFTGPVALTITLAAIGAGVPLCGPRLLSLWRRATRYGPELSVRRSSEVAA